MSAEVIPFPCPTGQPDAVAVYGRAAKITPVFTQGRDNACPSCNARSWHVGRQTAECAACGTALAIVHPASFGLPQ